MKNLPRIDYDNVNPEDYRDLDQPIKVRTYYSMLEVEPFPRLKLMKLCKIILEEMEEMPDDFYFKIYYTERIKWIMDVTHKYVDVEALEVIFEYEEIEHFIQRLSDSVIFIR